LDLSLESNNKSEISKNNNNMELIEVGALRQSFPPLQQILVVPEEKPNKPIKIFKSSSPKVSSARPLSGSLQLKVVESILEQCSLSITSNKEQFLPENIVKTENNIPITEQFLPKSITNKSGELQELPSGGKFLVRSEKKVDPRIREHMFINKDQMTSECVTTPVGSAALSDISLRVPEWSNEKPKEFNYSLPSGSHDMLNAHHHDGQMTSSSSLIYRERKVLDDIKMMSMTTKEPVIQSFMNSIVGVNVQENNQVSRQYLTTIFIAKNSTPNIDSTNGMSAYDILYMLAIEWVNINIKHREEINAFASEFFLQLLDIQTGTCPQGRVSRLWQIAYTYFYTY
jgi:hypothetical protein